MTQLQSLSFRLTAAPTEKRQTFFAVLAAVSVFLPYYITSGVIAAGAVYVLCGSQRRARIVTMPYSKLAFAAAGGGLVISLGYANYTGALASVLILCALTDVFYLRSFMTRRLFDRMMDVVCTGGIFAGLIAVVQKIAGNASTRPCVVFDNPNYFATVMEIAALVAVYRLLANPRRRNFYFAAAVFSGFGVYLSGSLSAFAVCACGIVFYLVLRGHIKAGIMVAASAVAFALLSGWGLPQIASLLENFSSDPSGSGTAVQTVEKTSAEILTIRTEAEVGGSIANRFSIWRTALMAVPDHLLLGQGPNTYAMVYSRYLGFASSHAHNMILDVILNYGIIGGGVIFFFALQQFYTAARKVRERKSTTTNLLLIVLCLMMAMHGMTDVTLLWPQTGLLFLLVYSSSGIRTVPQARCLMLCAPDFAPNHEFKRNAQ